MAANITPPEDFRNFTSDLRVSGIDISRPPDVVKPYAWTKLQNVDPIIDGIIQGRPLGEHHHAYCNAYNGTGVVDNITSGSVAAAIWPDVFAVQDGGIYFKGPIHGFNVGEVLDPNNDMSAAIVHICTMYDSGTSQTYWIAYLCGIPVYTCTGYTGGAYTGHRTILSTPSCVVTTSRLGFPMIILGGEVYIDLNNLDLGALTHTTSTSTAGNGMSFKLDIKNDAGAATTATCEYIPAWKLGITTPSTAITSLSASASTGSLDSGVTGASDYVWRYTYYAEKVGAESEVSPISAELAVEGSNNTATLGSIPVSSDPQVTKIRIYRKGGTLTKSWRLVKTIANTLGGGSPTSTTDTDADSTIAVNEKADLESTAPFVYTTDAGATTKEVLLPTSWGPFQGRFVFYINMTREDVDNGVGAAAYRTPGDAIGKSTSKVTTNEIPTNYVFWTNINDPFRCDPELGFAPCGGAEEELVGGFIFSSYAFAFSRTAFYALDYGGPDARPIFTARKLPLGMGAYEVVVAPDFVYFINDKGVWKSDMNTGLVSITDDSLYPLFHGQTINDMTAFSHASLWYTEPYLFMRGKTGAPLTGGEDPTGDLFQYDTTRGSWIKFQIDDAEDYDDASGGPQQPLSAWRDPISRTIYLGPTSGRLSAAYDYDHTTIWEFPYDRSGNDESSVAVKARTMSWDGGVPHTLKNFNQVIVDADSAASAGGTISFVPYFNNEQLNGTAETIGSAGRKLYAFLVSDLYADRNQFNMGLDFSWSKTATRDQKIYKTTILYRVLEEPSEWWSTEQTDFGLGADFFLRGLKIKLSTVSSAFSVYLSLYMWDGTELSWSKSVNTVYTNNYPYYYYLNLPAYRLKSAVIGIFSGTGSGAPIYVYTDESFIEAKPWQSDSSFKQIPMATQAGYADFLRKGGGT